MEYHALYSMTKNLSVLYVEDDTAFQQETCEILEYFFNDLTVCDNGEEALTKYTEYTKVNSKYFDIVITDVKMPNMCGLELSKNIYLHNENQIIIVISAHSVVDDLVDFINIGISHFLKKPLVYEDLLEILHKTSYTIKELYHEKILHDTSTTIRMDSSYTWNRDTSILKNAEKEVKLTKKEILLMEILINNASKVSSYEEISNALWGVEMSQTNMSLLAPVISRLRKKLSLEIVIENIYELGYKLILRKQYKFI